MSRIRAGAFRGLLILCLCFAAAPLCAAAGTNEADPGGEIYAGVWDLMDADTVGLLQSFGLDPRDAGSLFRLQPESVSQLVRALAADGAAEVRANGVSVLICLVFLAAGKSMAGASRLGAGLQTAGGAAALFSLTACTAATAKRCAAAVSATGAFAAALTPIYGGILSCMGEPASALQLQTGVFVFGQALGAVFTRLLPVTAALGTAFAAAGALGAFGDPAAPGAALQRCVRWGAGFLAAAYSAVLTVRSVFAQAGDSVAGRCARFFLGTAVPAVGSAMGDALNAVASGLGVTKTGVGLLGILTVAAVNLPALVSLLVWRLSLWGLEAAAGLFEETRLSRAISQLGGVTATLGAILVYNVFLYVAALALTLRLKGGG